MSIKRDRKTRFEPPVALEPIEVAREGNLRFLWHEVSPERGDIGCLDRGYLVSLLEVLENETQVGYLKTTSTTAQIARWIHPRGLSFMRERGHHLPDNLEDLDELWACAHRASSRVPPSAQHVRGSYNLTREHAPEPSVRDAEIAVLERDWAEQLREWRFDLEIPFVDFSRVRESHQGLGIGTSMYLRAAEVLGRTGRMLRASNNPSGGAERVWEKLERERPEILTWTTLRGRRRDEESKRTIDLRGPVTGPMLREMRDAHHHGVAVTLAAYEAEVEESLALSNLERANRQAALV